MNTPEMKFDVVFHHGGEFVKDWVLFYRGGSETIIQKQDFDDWSFVKANGYLLKMEYNENTYRMWRKMDDVDSGYKAMVLDQHVVDLGLYAMNKMEAAHIWVEHNVKDILENVACPAYMELGPSSDEDSDGSQQSVNVVRFEDSEEERADCVDDGFGITELPLTVPNTTESKKKLPVKRKGDMGESSAVGEGFAADYQSEDLDSTDPENSEAEGVGRDANDEYFPLAFGLVETETKESWKWFIQLLLEDIGQDNRWVFISDQQKGLMQVFAEMFERVEHRLCLRHLYANFKKRFGGGVKIRDLMMGAAKATYYQAWEEKMQELKKIDQKAWEWLMGVPTTAWFARDRPILTMYPEAAKRKRKPPKKGGNGSVPQATDVGPNPPPPHSHGGNVADAGTNPSPPPLNGGNVSNPAPHSTNETLNATDPTATKRKRKPSKNAGTNAMLPPSNVAATIPQPKKKKLTATASESGKSYVTSTPSLVNVAACGSGKAYVDVTASLAAASGLGKGFVTAAAGIATVGAAKKVNVRPAGLVIPKKEKKQVLKHLGIQRRTSGTLRNCQVKNLKGPDSSSNVPLVIDDDADADADDEADDVPNDGDQIDGDGNGELTQENNDPKLGSCLRALINSKTWFIPINR
ncbi:hypothetical protein P8452_67922 [Trifolium repens]|nr:hypothetical protein P8452_67922 [Trifolium repens]